MILQKVLKPKMSHKEANLRQVDFHRVPNSTPSNTPELDVEGTPLQTVKIHFDPAPRLC